MNIYPSQDFSTTPKQHGQVISANLLNDVICEDPEAQYTVGMQNLREGKVGFARIFLESAARNGHLLAKQHIKLFYHSKTILQWRDVVLKK